MKRTIGLIFKYLKLNLCSVAEYRASFLSSLFGVCVSDSAFIFFWWVAFSQMGGTIGGSDFRDVMFIWAGTAAAFGLTGILFGGAAQLSRLIVTGELDTCLLQPAPPLLSVICGRTDVAGWGDLIYGVALMALTAQGAAGWLGFLTSVLFGVPLMVCVMVSFGSLAFWLGDAEAGGGMAVEFIINFCIYPEGIYSGATRLIMYTLLPAGWIVHVPLRLARGGSALSLLALAAATGLYCALAGLCFRRGLRRYESGNLIVTRM